MYVVPLIMFAPCTDLACVKSVGIIVTNWLLPVDQSDRGIIVLDCLDLAQLHSDAVDYPKTGSHSEIDLAPSRR